MIKFLFLGGTPYGNISSNNEIPDKITKGIRLPQLRYISDEFYQLMLDCWQLDCDERPQFSALVESLESLKCNTILNCLSFNLYSNFQYEQFYPDMELAVRPVFWNYYLCTYISESCFFLWTNILLVFIGSILVNNAVYIFFYSF